MIARAISTRPKLLVLDEPTLGVDISGQQKFGSRLTSLGHVYLLAPNMC